MNKNRFPETLLRLIGAKFFLMVLAFISLVGLISCDKETTIGLNVQPKGDLLFVGYQDTTTIVTRTVKEDSLETDEDFITGGNPILGKYIDPYFGTASASLYTTVGLETTISSVVNGFGSNNPICDSVVLSLVYNGWFYGDAATKQPPKRQTLSVYQITNDLINAVPYYSNGSEPHTNIDLANNFTFVPDISHQTLSRYVSIPHWYGGPSDSIVPIYNPPGIRIPLSKQLGQTILNNQITNNLYGNDQFQAFFKGLYITADNTPNLSPGQGRILQYSIPSSNLFLYYHYYNADTIVHTNYAFYMNYVNRFSTFSTPHSAATYTTNDLITQLADNDTLHNYPVTYIQSMAGVKTKVRFPYLLNWTKQGKVAINQAILEVKVVPGSTTFEQNTYAPPPELIVYGINDDGTIYLLPDLTQAPYYFSGTVNATSNLYDLNISRYIQQVLDGKLANNGLYITIPSVPAVSSAYRLVLGGGTGNNAYKMKLLVRFTKLH